MKIGYDRIEPVTPHAIFVTHAHPDHCAGLRDGVDCPVYATAAAWNGMSAYKIEERHTIEVRNPLVVDGIGLEAFSVVHSLRARQSATASLPVRP